jgi:ribosomal protein S18 acetylase RimI-like enzyme
VETPDLLGPAGADASVRPATTADLPAVGAVHSRSWRTAYADHLPREVLDALEPDGLAQAWRTAVTAPPSPRHHVLVACAGSTVVGFAAGDGEGELVALHVDPAHQRRGHGSRLLSAAADLARADRVPVLSAWCPLVDTARRGFLESAGFGPDGAWRELEVPGAGGLRELRMVAALPEDG